MQILYAARMARWGLPRPACRLACYITKWTEACDKRLLQLVRYIHTSYRLRQLGWVGGSTSSITPRLYTDADLAGDAETQRSTSEVHLAIRGTNTSYPISATSTRQSCVSCSTPEAEVVCGHYAHKNVLFAASP